MVEQLYHTNGEDNGGRSSAAQLRELHQRLLVSEEAECAAIANAHYAQLEAEKIIQQQRDALEQMRLKAIDDEIVARSAKEKLDRSNRAQAARDLSSASEQHSNAARIREFAFGRLQDHR